MKALKTVGTVIFVGALSSAMAFAAEPQGTKDTLGDLPAVMVGAGAAGMATVEAVDMKSREITLRLADGKVESFVLGDEVRNLAQVEVGDIVVVEYSVGLIMALNPAGTDAPSRVDTLEAARAEPGQKPAGIVRKTVEATGTIVAVDRQARTVTLKGAKRTVTLPVAEDIDITKLKVGEQVDAVYQESLAISVQPAPAGE
jgi:Cu/Ag efflux protein CusF